jgi:hypothetical protein
MTNSAPFFPQMLSASEYVLALHSPEDRVAVLVRNRTRKQTLQRILAAEESRAPCFCTGSSKKTTPALTFSSE